MAKLIEEIGNYIAVIEVSSPGKAHLYWYNKEGKKLCTTPNSALEMHSKELNELKCKFKNIKSTLKLQTHRIEAFFLEGFQTSYSNWRYNFIDHPLMKSISCNLIWSFKQNSKVYSAIATDDGLVTADGVLLYDLEDNTRVSLWHPINTIKEEREAWRNYIWTNAINQPFRQAFREFYTEQDEKNQIGVVGIYVHQHQFRALLRSRGWRYELRGNFESESSPTFKIREDITCKICIGATSNVSSNNGIALAVELTEIQFLGSNVLLKNSHLHPIEYSEIMRDIDLFTSVAGLGFKKDWEQIEEIFSDVRNSLLKERFAKSREPIAIKFNKLILEKSPLGNTIFKLLSIMDVSMQKLPIPETVKTRALLLGLMLEGTSIEKKVYIEERYLYIDNSDRGYKINLASGLVFDSRENCLLPVNVKQKPLENKVEADTMLSRIYNLIIMFAR